MEQLRTARTTQPKTDSKRVMTCAHGRLIDDVLTKQGQRSGQVRCLECGAIMDDPYQGNR
jgi:uncharacterized Zn finger protein